MEKVSRIRLIYQLKGDAVAAAVQPASVVAAAADGAHHAELIAAVINGVDAGGAANITDE